MDKSDCIKVIVRVRPETRREEDSAASKNVVRVIDNRMLIFDPKEELDDFYFRGHKQKRRDLLKKQNKDLTFMFDYVFDYQSTNEQVYDQTTKLIIPELLNGFNCSVFAYGATGAGKTYTMLGSEVVPGIAFMTVMELYTQMEAISDKKCDITISYLEVYNEAIKDLISPSKNLFLREDPQRGPQVNGLSFHKPKNAEDLLNMLIRGNTNRTQHPTDANAESSRSHAVFQVYVKIQDKNAGLNASVRIAKLSLVDLAGSERAAVALGQGARLREGANINKSLLALANCINALADKKAKTPHVPYRNSKLTHLLKDSLGGNCRTIMIAAVSPSSLHYEDTYNTLKYADRARSIQLTLKKNVVQIGAHLSNYTKIVEDLKKEISTLKNQIKTIEKERDELRVTSQKFSQENRSGFGDELPEISSWEENYQKLRNELLECESNLKQVEIKMRWRQHCNERINHIISEPEKLLKSVTKPDIAFKSLQAREKRLHTKKAIIEKELEQAIGEPMPKRIKMHKLTGDVEELKIQSKHLIEVALTQEKQLSQCERILVSTLDFISKQQLILQGHGFLTQDLKSEYDTLVKQVKGSKEVVWADQAEQTHSAMSPLLRLPIHNILTPRRKSGGKRSLVHVWDPEDDPNTPKETPLRSSPRLRNIQLQQQQGLDSTFSLAENSFHQDTNATFCLTPTTPRLNIGSTSGVANTTFVPKLPLSFAQVVKSPAPKRPNIQENNNHKFIKPAAVPKIHRPFFSGATSKPIARASPRSISSVKRINFTKENRAPTGQRLPFRANPKRRLSIFKLPEIR